MISIKQRETDKANLSQEPVLTYQLDDKVLYYQGRIGRQVNKLHPYGKALSPLFTKEVPNMLLRMQMEWL